MSLSSAAASASLKRSCSLAISSSSPRARSRETPTGGSVRVAMARCDGARQVVEQEAHAVVDRRIGDQVVVVEHQHVLARPARGQRVDQQRQRGVAGRRCRARRRPPRTPPAPRRPPCAARPRRRPRSAPGRCRPRRARATRPPPRPRRSATRPAGSSCPSRRARRRGSAAGADPSRSRPTRSARRTCPGRGRGGSIFVTSSAPSAMAVEPIGSSPG